jgi:hypothetical protein
MKSVRDELRFLRLRQNPNLNVSQAIDRSYHNPANLYISTTGFVLDLSLLKLRTAIILNLYKPRG